MKPSINDFRKDIEKFKMPNGKEFGKCSRIELYDIITEAMQFIVVQSNDINDLKQRLDLLAEIKKRKEESTIMFKIKSLINVK